MAAPSIQPHKRQQNRGNQSNNRVIVMLLPGVSAVSYSRRACLPLFIEGFSKHATRTRKQCTSRLGNLTRSSSSKPRSDPFAKRPNKVCDPYGQGGKPLSRVEAEGFQATLHDDWKIEGDDVPTKIVREFAHPDFLAGARFIQKAAAVATIHNHFPPVICLERRIFQKNWQVVTRIECRTTVLDGLSKHDFHLAMMVDVEANRPEVRELLSERDNQ